MAEQNTDSIKKILTLAREKDKPVIIMYMSKKEITRRKIRVLSVDEHRVYAYCYLREKNRFFLFENMLSVQFCE